MNNLAPALLAGFCFVSVAAAAEKPLATIPVKDSTKAEALTRDTALPYSYAELAYTMTKFDDISVDGDTLALNGSYLFMPNIFAVGSYTSGSLDTSPSLDITTLQLGAGYRYPLSMTTDVAASLEFVQAKAEAGSASDDDSGYQLTVGVRGLFMDKIEGAGGLMYTDVGDDAATTLNLSALYNLSQWVPQLQAGVDLALGDEPVTAESAKSYGLKVRYSF